MGNKKRFVTNMAAQLLSFIVNLGINFFLSRYIVNVIGKEVYGFVGLANNFTSYAQIFTVAFNAMLSRYVTVKLVRGEPEEANRYLSSVTICNVVISAVLLIPSALLCCFMQYLIEVPAQHMFDIKILWFLLFLGFLIQLGTNTFQTCFFASNRLDLSARRSLENYILRAVILVIAFSFFQPHIWYVGLASIICAVCLAIFNWYYMKKLTPSLRIRKSLFSARYVKELVKVGIWNSINQLSQLLLNGFDLLITNIFIGSSEMGMLSIAKSIPTQLLSFIGTVSNVFSPRMTIIYASGDKKAFLQETSFAMRVCGALCSVPLIGFVIFGRPFYTLWMSSLSEAEVMQVQILSILTLLPTIFSVYIYPLYNVNTITCKLKIPVLVSCGIGVLNLIIVYILLNTTDLGIYAVAGVSSVLLLFRVLIFVPIYAAHNVEEYMLTFYPPLLRGIVSSVLMIVVFRFVLSIYTISNWISLICMAAFCGIIGYAVNYYIVFSREERKKLLVLLREKIGRKR